MQVVNCRNIKPEKYCTAIQYDNAISRTVFRDSVLCAQTTKYRKEKKIVMLAFKESKVVPNTAIAYST